MSTVGQREIKAQQEVVRFFRDTPDLRQPLRERGVLVPEGNQLVSPRTSALPHPPRRRVYW